MFQFKTKHHWAPRHQNQQYPDYMHTINRRHDQVSAQRRSGVPSSASASASAAEAAHRVDDQDLGRRMSMKDFHVSARTSEAKASASVEIVTFYCCCCLCPLPNQGCISLSITERGVAVCFFLSCRADGLSRKPRSCPRSVVPRVATIDACLFRMLACITRLLYGGRSTALWGRENSARSTGQRPSTPTRRTPSR